MLNTLNNNNNFFSLNWFKKLNQQISFPLGKKKGDGNIFFIIISYCTTPNKKKL